VIRILIGNAPPVYIVEIQRRPEKKKDKHGNAMIGEESMTGCVFTLYDQSFLDMWIRILLDRIREAKGIFKKIVGVTSAQENQTSLNILKQEIKLLRRSSQCAMHWVK